jgi:hypothetical protein
MSWLRLAAVHVDHEGDAAGVVLERGVVMKTCGGTTLAHRGRERYRLAARPRQPDVS